MQTNLALFVPALAAACIALCLTPVVSRIAVLAGAIDMPGERKIHSRPVPRLGGLAVLTAIAAVWGATGVVMGTRLPTDLSLGLGLGLLPIVAISILDDIKPVAAGRKLLAHVAGAVLAVACGVSLGPEVHLFNAPLQLGMLAAPLSILWLVGVTNAFNIIDGLDGLSAGLALISALSMAAVFSVVGQPVMAGATLVLAGALAGFLPYNVHPARLFLGDTGATAIGFCLATFALKGGSTLSTGFAALVPVFILGLPIADTLIAMARRTVTRLERGGGGVFVPDRNHIHHRLLALGVDHRNAVLILYAAGLTFAGVAFVSMLLKARHAAMFILGLLAAGFIGIHRLGYDEFAFIRRGTVLRVYEQPVFRKSMFVVFIDLAMTFAAAYVAVALKLDAWRTQGALVLDLAVTFAPITAVVFWQTGMYRGSWRVAGVADLARAVAATITATTAGAITHSLLSPMDLPISVFIIYGLVSLLLVTSSRASYVLLLNSQRRASNQGTPALIYGAGRRGVAAVRELFENPGAGLLPVAFVDDDPDKQGKTINGVPVLGTAKDLRRLVVEHGVEAVLIAGTAIGADAVDAAATVCKEAGISLLRLHVEVKELSDEPRHVQAAQSAAPYVPAAVTIPDTLEEIGEFASSTTAWTVESEPCKRCTSSNVHRSKTRNIFERLRKERTLKRLYRCHECGWRGWLLPLETAAPLDVAPTADLTGIDTLLEASLGASATYIPKS